MILFIFALQSSSLTQATIRRATVMATGRWALFLLLAAAVGLNACAAEVLSGGRDARGSTYLYAVREKRWKVRAKAQDSEKGHDGSEEEPSLEGGHLKEKGLEDQSAKSVTNVLQTGDTSLPTVEEVSDTDVNAFENQNDLHKSEKKPQVEGEVKKDTEGNKEKRKEPANEPQETLSQPTDKTLKKTPETLKTEKTQNKGEDQKNETSLQDETKKPDSDSTTTSLKDDDNASDGSHIIAWSPAVLLMIAMVHSAVC